MAAERLGPVLVGLVLLRHGNGSVDERGRLVASVGSFGVKTSVQLPQ